MPDDSVSTVDKIKEILKKFLSPNSKPSIETFPELVDCVIWLRFFLGALFGLWIGNESPNRGGANIMFGLNLIAFVPVLYCNTFLVVDQESYGVKLLFSGILQGLALSMLIWIYCYSSQHPEDEAIFASAYGKLISVEEVVSGSDAGIPEESEF